MAANSVGARGGAGFRRLAWLFAVGLVLAQAALLTWNLERGYHRTLDTEYARLGDATRIANENMSGTLRAIDLLLRDVASEHDRLGTTESASLTDYMRTRARAFPEVRTVFITNADGFVTASTRHDNLGMDAHERPYYTAVHDAGDRDRTYFSPLMLDVPTNVNLIFATRALTTGNGRWAGVVSASLDIKVFHDLLASIRPDGDDSTILLAGNDGRIISRIPDNERFVGFKLSEGSGFAQHMTTGQRVSLLRFTAATDHIDKIGTARSLAGGSYVVIIARTVSDVLGPWRLMAIEQGLASLMLSLAVLAMTGIAVRHHNREARAKASLLISEVKYRGLIETQIDMVLRIGIDGAFTFVNDTVCQVLGLTRNELLGRNWQDFVNPEDHPATAARIVATLSPPHPRVRVSNRLLTQDGERWYAWEGSAVSGYCCSEIEVQAVGRDITKHKAYERRIRELMDFNNSIITECPIGILVYNSSGQCVLANEAITRVVGGTVESLIKQNFHELASWKKTGIYEAALDALAGTAVTCVNIYCTSTFGKSIWADFYLHPFTSADERHLLVIINDVTAWHEAENALTDAKLRAEAADRAKSQFLAMMSHELRTPLNSILGFAELIRDQTFGPVENPQYVEYADYIYVSGHHLLHLLNDVLDLSKIEAGRMTLTTDTLNLGSLIADCSRIFRTKASMSGIGMTTDIEDIGTAVLADERAIRQVLFNLLSNAIKFTQTGGVTLRVSITERKEDEVAILVEVLDTGIGISPEQRPLLFKPFSQLAQTNSRRFEGTGLGLVITQRLVEMMNGTIGVESEPGKGSRFWFSLPLRIARPADTTNITPSVQHKAAAVRPLRILVAEDNHINQMLVRSILQKGGHSIEVAFNGRIAVEAVTARRFDVVLMDMQMPEMDGEEATRAIRAMPPPHNRLPVIALTADAMPEHRERYFACGVDALVAKPIEVSVLLAAIEALTAEDKSVPFEPTLESDSPIRHPII